MSSVRALISMPAIVPVKRGSAVGVGVGGIVVGVAAAEALVVVGSTEASSTSEVRKAATATAATPNTPPAATAPVSHFATELATSPRKTRSNFGARPLWRRQYSAAS